MFNVGDQVTYTNWQGNLVKATVSKILASGIAELSNGTSHPLELLELEF